MYRFFRIALLCFLATHDAFGQRENGIWYFGNQAGVNFNDCSPTALTDGALTSLEGCAAISDRLGKLLFYTNGVTVYTASHQFMKNGDGLGGDVNSTQSSLIVPHPGNDSLFYLFTLGFKDLEGALYYSIINMNGDGGNGEVLPDKKNIFVMGSLTEKLAGIFHANQRDTWVVVHTLNTNSFSACLVSDQGVAAPVSSEIGLVNSSSYGYLNSSLDGKKLASAISYLNAVEVFDFNNSTGTLSNAKALYFSANVYGVCFSPDKSNLYVSENPDKIYQFELSSDDDVKIRNSKTLIGTNSNVPVPGFGEFAGALQLGLDGRIYNAVYNRAYLGVIEKPNRAGTACNFKNNGFDLGGKQSEYGLPNFVPREFTAPVSLQPNINLGNDTLLCADSRLLLDATCLECSYLWQDGSTEATFTVTNSGTYSVNVQNRCGSDQDAIHIDFEECLVASDIPNVITPNGDQLNDTFVIPVLLNGQWELQVYNRWGRLLYHSENYQNDMDAKDFKEGIYFYHLSDSHSGRHYKGWLEVLR